MPKTMLCSLLLFAAGSATVTWWAAERAGDSARRADQVIGVRSGALGTEAEETPKKGVRQLVPPPPPPTRTPDASRPPAVPAATATRQTIDGVRGTEASAAPPRNEIESVRRVTGSIEPIHRVEGVHSPTLRNLEVVLRMQAPPTPPPPNTKGGRATSATTAKLLTLEKPEMPPPEEPKDDRVIDAQFRQREQDGS